MRLDSYIRNHLETIIADWNEFARLQLPAAASMSDLALRDEVQDILLAVADDLARPESEVARYEKGRGGADLNSTAAAIHGTLRHASGFSLKQLHAEFRALRASVMRLWLQQKDAFVPEDADQMLRFNEAVDQATAESIVNYEVRMENTRDLYLAILGHDLRSPLAAIEAVGELLSNPEIDVRVREKIVTILRRSAIAMRAMVDDLMEYARTKLDGGIPVLKLDTDLRPICESVIEEVTIAHPDFQFLLEAKSVLPVHADAARLRQAIANLLNNAADHADVKKPVVTRLERHGRTVFVHISSGGIIPPERLATLFDPFQTLGEDREKSGRSHLGLGLYIAHQIARAHGGDILVKSDPTSGTVFSLEIPVR
jgi:signal transduction histidine kinase